MNSTVFLRRDALKLGAASLCAAAFASVTSTANAQSTGPIRIALVESMSGPFANTGESVFRNLLWAVERVNARGGIKLPGGARMLQLDRYDSKGQIEEALSALRAAMDDGARIVMQGNSSATAAALIDAIDKNNERDPSRRVIFLNYSAVDPVLTNERCSFWHFRFDANADMRVNALMDAVKDDKSIKRIYLIGQDYSFGQSVLRESKRQIEQQRPDIRIVGDELHPLGKVKDFSPYATKILSSGAQAVVTGNWGNDLTLMVKAAREVGYRGKFYTFYGNALGAPGAIGDAGVGRLIAVADWLPNLPTPASEAFYQAFRQRFPKPADDYMYLRMHLMIEALAKSIERARSTDPVAVATALETVDVTVAGQRGHMRAVDHQFQQPLMVGVMEKQGAPGVKFDVEGSGYGFRVVKTIDAAHAELPTTCRMNRPA